MSMPFFLYIQWKTKYQLLICTANNMNPSWSSQQISETYTLYGVSYLLDSYAMLKQTQEDGFTMIIESNYGQRILSRNQYLSKYYTQFRAYLYDIECKYRYSINNFLMYSHVTMNYLFVGWISSTEHISYQWKRSSVNSLIVNVVRMVKSIYM